MAELNVELKQIHVGYPPTKQIFVTINGRQALEEGPRHVGHCCYCGHQCDGLTNSCETRVYDDARSGKLKR